MAWMEGSNAELGEKTYEELLGTLEVAEMWDKKDRLNALDALTSFKGITSNFSTRSTPFDGMRMLYIEHQVTELGFTAFRINFWDLSHTVFTLSSQSSGSGS